MAELNGRKAIAEHLGVTCGEASRLRRHGLPATFDDQRMVARTERIDAWKRERSAGKEI